MFVYLVNTHLYNFCIELKLEIYFYRPQRSWGKVIFHRRLWFCSRKGGGGIPACIAGGIPASLASGLGGVVSQHALQVSRPTPRGEVRGIWPGGVSRPTPKGEVEGDLAGGVSRPTPKGEVGGSGQGGSPGPHLGGCLLWGGAWSGGV